MKIFWENIKRYPRFFVSSISGLILVILGNILKQTKKNKILNNPFFIIIFLSAVIFIIEQIFFAILNL
jgi:hypothetical protein